MLVSVDGRLTPDDSGGPRIWEKDGISHSSYEVTAQEVIFLTKSEETNKPAPIDDEPF